MTVAITETFGFSIQFTEVSGVSVASGLSIEVTYNFGVSLEVIEASRVSIEVLLILELVE